MTIGKISASKTLCIFVMIVISCSSISHVNADTSVAPSHLANVSSLPGPQNSTNNVMIHFHPINSTAFTIAKNQSATVQYAKRVSVPVLGPAPYITPNIASVASGGIEGIDKTQSGFTPPDVAMGVGPNHVVEFNNVVGKIWNKSGGSIGSTFSLNPFFNAANTDALSDPRIIYDPVSGRWFASILDITTSSVRLAVSTTNDPTGSWTTYNIQFGSGPSSGVCPDQPKIGVSSDKFVVAGSDFSNFCDGSFLGADFFVINKSQMLSASSLTPLSHFGPDASKSAIFPVLTNQTTLYMVSTDGGGTNKVHLFSLTGVPGVGGSVTKTVTDLTVKTMNTPPDGIEPTSPTNSVNTGDNRVTDAKWSNNKLWLAFNDACTPIGDTARSCVRLVQVNTGTPTVLQDFDIGFFQKALYYPALSIENSKSLDVISGYSSSTVYPSLLVTGQSAFGSPGSYQDPVVIASGSQSVTDGRYGDYFSGALDPSNGTKSWVAGQYMHLTPSGSSSRWSTFITSTTVTNPSLSLSTSFGTIGNTITVKGGFFDDNVLATIKYDSTTKVTTTTDVNGNFSIPLTIPSSIFGSHQISALVPNYSTLTSTFTVNPSISIDTSSGSVGQSITVSGNGFAASSSTAIKYDGVTKTTVTTNSTGSFKTVIPIPESPAGSNSISAVDTSSHTDLKTFTVTPQITITPTSGSASTSIVVTGNGFAASSSTTIRYDGIVKNTVTTNSAGSFTSTIQASSSVVGNYAVSATDSSSNSDSVQFTFTSSVTVLPSSGPVGQSVTIKGHGLLPNSLTTIKYDGVNQTTTNTNSTGDFNTTFSIPSSTIGVHQITAMDAGNNSLSSTFIVVLPGQAVLVANDTVHTFAIFTPTIPTILLSPPSAGVGHVITITGTHFAPLHAITIKFGGTTLVANPASLKSDSTGAFTATFVVPLSAITGNHTITVFSSGNVIP